MVDRRARQAGVTCQEAGSVGVQADMAQSGQAGRQRRQPAQLEAAEQVNRLILDFVQTL